MTKTKRQSEPVQRVKLTYAADATAELPSQHFSSVLYFGFVVLPPLVDICLCFMRTIGGYPRRFALTRESVSREPNKPSWSMRTRSLADGDQRRINEKTCVYLISLYSFWPL